MNKEAKEAELLACAPSVRVANCSSCGDLLVSEEVRRRYPHDTKGIRDLFVKVKGRPYCRTCVSATEVN